MKNGANVKLELVRGSQGPRGPRGTPIPLNTIKALGTLLAFKMVEGVLYAGHAVMKRASKRVESKMYTTNRREKSDVR